MTTTAELLALCAGGDGQAFRRLYELHSARLYGIALRITRQQALAADAVHDALLQVWRNAARYDPERGNADGWLISLVRYRALDIARRQVREVSGLDLPDRADTELDALSRMIEGAESDALRTCLGEVEESRRQLIVLAFMNGMTHAELAEHVGQPLGTVKSSIRRVLLGLRSCLRTIFGGDGAVPGRAAMSESVRRDNRSVLAAQYVLGTLEIGQRRSVEALVEQEPDFAAELADWERGLLPLADLVPPVTPPDSLWARLALATGLGSGAPREIRAEPRPVAEIRPLDRAPVRRWQAATAGALALAASLAVVTFLPRAPVPVQPILAAAIAPTNAPTPFLAQARPDGQVVLTNLTNVRPVSGRSLQLWSLPPGAAAPVSLGLVQPGQQVITPGAAMPAQTQLLISDEPSGGSPTGQPTGSVVYGGRLTPLSAP